MDVAPALTTPLLLALVVAGLVLALHRSRAGRQALALELADVHRRHDREVERLSGLALHDALTGLPNRVLLLDRLRHALQSQDRRGGGVGVLFLDLDGFKAVNDGFGHAVGDDVLATVAARLRTAVRAGDTPARLSGDEFVVVCEGVEDDLALQRAAARLERAVGAPFEVAGHTVVLGVSVGRALNPSADHRGGQPRGQPAARAGRPRDVRRQARPPAAPGRARRAQPARRPLRTRLGPAARGRAKRRSVWQRGGVPELPEIASLVSFLRERAVGRVVARIDVPGIHVLKTYAPPITSLAGLEITGADRHGKFLDLDVSGLHLVTHLSRAGWLHWRASLPPAPPPDGQGTDRRPRPPRRRVGLRPHRGRYPEAPGGVRRQGRRRGPRGLPAGHRPAVGGVHRPTGSGSCSSGVRAQVKGVLTDQSVIAGVGNAYSDEVLWEVGMSPFKQAATLTPAQVERLHAALVGTLRAAVERSAGSAAGELKAEKKSNLNVHGRTGLPCPRCGTEVHEVSFATKSLQYCPTCQTGGKPLADRRLSRLLK